MTQGKDVTPKQKKLIICEIQISIPLKSNPRAKVKTKIGSGENDILTTTRSVAVSSVQDVIKELDLKPRFRDGTNIFTMKFEIQ